jgi:hypothetical protein
VRREHAPRANHADGRFGVFWGVLWLKNPNPIRLFFFDFFLVRFWAFLGKGSSKTP